MQSMLSFHLTSRINTFSSILGYSKRRQFAVRSRICLRSIFLNMYCKSVQIIIPQPFEWKWISPLINSQLFTRTHYQPFPCNFIRFLTHIYFIYRWILRDFWVRDNIKWYFWKYIIFEALLNGCEVVRIWCDANWCDVKWCDAQLSSDVN